VGTAYIHRCSLDETANEHMLAAIWVDEIKFDVSVERRSGRHDQAQA
jgi:hypothetical protein